MDVLVRAGLARRGPVRTVRGGTEQYFVRAGAMFTLSHLLDGAPSCQQGSKP
jgi:hypothetical protein